MKLVKNSIIPFSGYKAINLFGVLFYKGEKPNDVIINHESIHTAQMREMLYVFFYLWYAVEWFVRLFQHGDEYRGISFEKEAYNNERDADYLKGRRHFAWWKYVRMKN